LPTANGYGGDPKLTKLYHPGDVWPLTLSAAQRRTAAALLQYYFARRWPVSPAPKA